MLVETVRGFSARDFKLLITTHSPYILSAFNNLLYAGSIAADSSKEETVIQKLNEIVPRTMRIKPNTLSAYMVENGSALSLIHEETGLISAEAIDEASDQLSQEFNELLEL